MILFLVLQCVQLKLPCSALQMPRVHDVLFCVVVCCSVLQCVAVCCNAMQMTRVHDNLLGVVVFCSVVQCVAVCCSAL